MKQIQDYKNPFDAILDFESAIAKFTGAPYVVTIDCCTHAIEISLRLTYTHGTLKFPARTYISVPMTMSKLDIPYEMHDAEWTGEYLFENTKIWDSARLFSPNMYRPGFVQCISFGRSKPLTIGYGGCLLTDNQELYESASRMRSDGRNLFKYSPWITQQRFEEGYHYWMRPEHCVLGLNKLEQQQFTEQTPDLYNYPDCRIMQIDKYKKIKI